MVGGGRRWKNPVYNTGYNVHDYFPEKFLCTDTEKPAFYLLPCLKHCVVQSLVSETINLVPVRHFVKLPYLSLINLFFHSPKNIEIVLKWTSGMHGTMPKALCRVWHANASHTFHFCSYGSRLS